MLQKLALQNFRNFAEKTISFSPLTAIVGPNGSGKTNILEAIVLLSTGHGIYKPKVDELILFEHKIARVKAKTEKSGEKEILEVVLTNGFLEEGGIIKKTPKKRFLADNAIRRNIDFVGRLRTVLFTPRDLDIVTGTPTLRRNFLDILLSQIDREYRRNLGSYEKGIRARNKLLWKIREFGGSRSALYFWDKLVIKNGQYITSKRAEFLDYLNSNSRLGDVSYNVLYDVSHISENRLLQYEKEEVDAAMTLVGPHRDDFEIRVKTRNIEKFGSRGEQRMAVLWLKLNELEYLSKSVERPTLLLDDIFSELDHKHRKIVFDVAQKQQTIMTSADPHYLEEFKSFEKIEI